MSHHAQITEILLRISAVLVQVRRNEDTNLHRSDQSVFGSFGVGLVLALRHLHRIGSWRIHRFTPTTELRPLLWNYTPRKCSSQRGVMLSYADGRDPAFNAYAIRRFGNKDRTNCFRCGRCSSRKTSGARWRRSRRNRRIWRPRFEKLLQLCEAGDIAQAYKLRNENKVIFRKDARERVGWWPSRGKRSRK